MSLKKIWQKWFLDTLITSFSTFSTLLILVFITVFSIGFFCAHWTDKVDLSTYKPYDVFMDNIADRRVLKWFTDILPVDVVYTWVNGSDPKFIEEIERLHSSNKKGRPNCYLIDCFPSPYLSLEIKNGTEIIFDKLPHLKIKRKVELSIGDNHRYFFIIFAPEENALDKLNKEVKNVLGNDTKLEIVYWTYDPKLDWTIGWKHASFIRLNSEKSFHDEISSILPYDHHLLSKNCKVSSFNNNHVIECDEVSIIEKFNNEIKNYKKSHIEKFPQVFNAYFLLNYGTLSENLLNRYFDCEELRYSLRSLELNAPWIRKVFLVTNGQIPHWLNIEHPKLTLITHNDIFPNDAHLPTFSSPAIESHIHRIPGLSENFLYFNDDIMLGKPIWPEDFYSKSSGYKIRLAWNLPECSPGCPSSWINDGFCDEPCNTSSCNWDGEDCSKLETSLHTEFEHDYSHLFEDNDDFCAPSCSDIWLGDSFCDPSCIVESCGYDVGDCGLDVIAKNLYEIKLPTRENATINLPPGELAAWLNIAPYIVKSNKYSLEGHHHSFSKAVRKVVVNTTVDILVIVLKAIHSGMAHINVTSNVQDNKNNSFKEIVVSFNLTFNTSTTLNRMKNIKSLMIENQFLSFSSVNNSFSPKILEMKFKQSLKNGQYSNFSKDFIDSLNDLEMKLNNKEINEDEFLAKKDETIRSFMKRQSNTQLSTDDNEILNKNFPGSTFHNNGTNESRKLLWVRTDQNYAITSSSRKSEVLSTASSNLTQFNESQSYGPKSSMDMFGESLIYVNRLYNAIYGLETRKVVAHVPHFVNKNIMQNLHAKFSNEFLATSSHKLRQPNDMQFAFSYFYFIIGEKVNLSPEEIFDQYDTDHSGTWSDREIRNFLTATSALPILYNQLLDLHKEIKDCNERIQPAFVSTPAFERYADSDIPTVSKELIMNCKNSSIERKLTSIATVPKFHFSTLNDEDVIFKKIISNVSIVFGQLDDIRKNKRKFICINNDMNPNSAENDLIKALLLDLLESFFPIPSSFELPPYYRNKFLYMSNLKEWKKWRSILRALVYSCLSTLILITVATFFGKEIESMKRRFCRRKRRPLLKEEV